MSNDVATWQILLILAIAAMFAMALVTIVIEEWEESKK